MMFRMEPRPADVFAGIEQSVDAVFVGDASGRVFYVNQAGRRLMGGGPEELTAAGHNGITCADPTLWESMFEDRRRKGWMKGVAPISRLDGTVFWAGVSSTTFTPDGEEQCTLWIVRDVTPRVQMTRRLEAYDEIVEALLAGRGASKLLDLVAAHACVIFDAAFAAVVTPEPTGRGVTIAAAAGAGASELVGRTYPPGGLSERVMDSAVPQLIDDITAMTRTEEIRDLALRAGMIVPVVSAEGAIGTLFIGSGPACARYDERDLADAEVYAARAAIALALEAARSEAERAKNELAEQLQQALESRVYIEQAKGFISCLRDISTEEAFRRLRAYARSHNSDIHTVARQIVDRELIL